MEIEIDNSVKKWIVRFRTNSKKSTIEVRNKGVFEINSPLDISRYQKEIIEAVTPFI
ncbi:hypothetical protein [Streptococcus pseudoporcinus]|uniref:Type I restriction enzyme related protein n=1 Tax=Streptococcus pseudoporcinus TaxID=361101 RepID=A0A4U9XGV8_9STRE|nr:hypothetical protein [Streptococcus pseudoporcinus]VTS12353.1 type I restriction enzyme related protein [Streptococcus pseudoporcinus]VUC64879.1 type I restriction enzyme related protein [Streptococcus pseudoporcinus]VUC95359.1 type I restriction enzyme related protein [Streptococcus pseudoporcinus]VUC95733.1 type I restriction enzyme related protein [Streptococcus pseudoporcinus]